MVNPNEPLYFPDRANWQTCETGAGGLQTEAIASARDYAQAGGARQLMVLHAGKILMEHNWGVDAQHSEDVFALQKAVFSWLIGIAQTKGLLHIDDSLARHLGTGWSQLAAAQESAIKIRHVLTMTTGINDQLQAQGETGVSWYYNNAVYNHLKYGLERIAGSSLNAITHSWLGEPLGLTRTVWQDRKEMLDDRRPYTSLMMNARDVARLGLAVLANGRFGQHAVLDDPNYLRAAITPGSTQNPAWGYLWWINGQSHYMQAFSDRVNQGAFAPNAPTDMIGARGMNEQRLLIIPSRSLVIVRLGDKAPKALGNFDNEFVSRLLQGIAP